MINHQTVLVIVSAVLMALVGIRFAVSEILTIFDQYDEWKERRKRRNAKLSIIDNFLNTSRTKSSIAAPTITSCATDHQE